MLLKTPELRFVRDLVAQGLGYPLAAPEPVAGLDWGRVAFLLDWHGLSSWVLHVSPQRLAEVPATSRAAIQGASQLNSARVLGQQGFLSELDRVRNGIPFIVLKGIAVSQRHYGNPAIRYCGDLDLLVPERRAIEVADLLKPMGYRASLSEVPSGADPLQWKFRHRPEITYVREGSATASLRPRMVDVHHRLSVYRSELEFREEEFAAAPRMRIGAAEIAVLPDSMQLPHLLNHGAISCWRRFKWIVDVDRELELLGDRKLPVECVPAQARPAFASFLRIRAALFQGREKGISAAVVVGLNSIDAAASEHAEFGYQWSFLWHELSLAGSPRRAGEIVGRKLLRVVETPWRSARGVARLGLLLLAPLVVPLRWWHASRGQAHRP